MDELINGYLKRALKIKRVKSGRYFKRSIIIDGVSYPYPDKSYVIISKLIDKLTYYYSITPVESSKYIQDFLG